jgi:hypothetical protein
MPAAYLSYSLQDGYIGNWLVAGPQAIPLDPDGHVAWEEDTAIEGAPVERGPLDAGLFRAGGSSGAWAYHACPEDHCVDHSGFYSRRHHLRSWAYAELVADTPQPAILEFTADGPAGVWLDGVPVCRAQHGTGQCPIKLQAGATPLMVRFECAAALGHTPHAMALRVHAEGVHVRIPTLIASTGRRAAFEQLTAGVYLERDVHHGDAPIVVHWPGGERAFCPAHVRLHGEHDSIHALADTSGEPGAALTLGFAVQLPAGPLRVTLMPTPDEVYLQNTRIYHHLSLWSMGRQRYYPGPASEDLADRRGEALRAVGEYADSPFAQIARMALGAWRDVDSDVLLRAIDAPSSMQLVALLGMLYRFGDHERFPQQLQRPLEKALLGVTYSESAIVTQAAEILAGQRYPRRIFADGQTGAWHRVRGERLALDWMTSFGSYGSADPGAPDAMEREIVALSHLADLAEDTHVYELAAVCTDKLLFTLAVNSRQGVLGAASRSARPSFVKSGYLQPTAGVSRLLWGSGIYNHHVGGVLSLACASGYDPPPILEAIAHDAPAEMWSRERHAPPDAQPTEMDLYKTPDYLVASLRSFSPTDHADWRVTFGPEAVVFANHPASSSESDSRAPGYWVGNARAPRVAQWKDVLIAMHRLDNDDVFGFTHAYFPCFAFDEYVLRDGWAFGRVGEGYLAITNSRGLVLTSEGRHAFRELRAFGAAQTWLVQLGRTALDGDFTEFRAKVLTRGLEFDGELVRWTTLRGDVLSFGWSSAFSVNGLAPTAGASKHYENVYTTTDLPCEQMEIRHRDDYLRLDFGAP